MDEFLKSQIPYNIPNWVWECLASTPRVVLELNFKVLVVQERVTKCKDKMGFGMTIGDYEMGDAQEN